MYILHCIYALYVHTKQGLSLFFERLITSLFDLVRFQQFTTDYNRNSKTEADDKRDREYHPWYIFNTDDSLGKVPNEAE